MRTYYLAILILLGCLFCTAQRVDKTKVPDWVNPIPFIHEEASKNQGGYQYLLLDFQDNLPRQNVYRHYAIKVLNTKGIQEMSDIDVTYDPSYQKLEFHQIRLVRNGTIIDRLGESTINVFQRETQMERSLYDGSFTAVINLWDVREGDIIEYAFSIKGFNPINKGNYSTTLYQEYTSPVNRIYNRIITNKTNKIWYKLLEGASEPTVTKTHKRTEYIWDLDGSQNKLYDSNVPPWFDIQKRVSISTMEDWGKVVDWAKGLYTYPTDNLSVAKELMIEDEPLDERIVQLIRFVQDEIRYLGFESGIGAYKPNIPSKVYRQRYGDCKDKSLLLVSLLRKEGVSSFPLLVNTQLRDGIRNLLPSHNIFDHCIVYFNFEGKDFYVDPTISDQGGNLENLSFPNYGTGLLVKSNEDGLITISKGKKSGITINERIRIDSIQGSATLSIETEYTGGKADYIRSYFNNTPMETIEKEYINYYSNLYPQIAFSSGIKLNDGLRNSYNSVYVEEYYEINEFWSKSEEGILYCETYPLVLESLINYPVSAKRNMPYHLGEPHSFSQKTTIELPENWPVNATEKTIEGTGFKYTNSIKGFGSSLSVAHTYDLDTDTLPADQVALFQEKNDEIKNSLSYYLTYDSQNAGFKLSWVSILLLVLAVISGFYFSLKIFREYNPKPQGNGPEKPIGGWLILPAIGLLLSPILILVQVVSEDQFNEHIWSAFYNLQEGQSLNLVFLYGAEQFYNYLLITFSVLLIILFFKKRTSLPILITIYYTLAFLVPLIDLILVEQLVPGQLGEAETMASYKEIARSFITAAIWIPYFNISQRVKDTFCRTYENSKVSVVIQNSEA
ncbi:DUF3857 domain-containing protein [Ulvibacterium sp.]|uniref:DUF3857 domain-containing protein n=1 Tax=Ulvibacterium sp. TaxID=2665914 RepID=UPI0026230C2D|nr:DUF3857 domain-containing protein [Ulvibacterium sp.]